MSMEDKETTRGFGPGRKLMGKRLLLKRAALFLVALCVLINANIFTLPGACSAESEVLSGRHEIPSGESKVPLEESQTLSEEDITELLESLLAGRMKDGGADSLQEWVDTALLEEADGTGGWYLIALSQGGWSFNGEGCRRKLEETAKEEKGSITKRLRMALTMAALGSRSSFIRETVETLSDENSLMPLVFGLNLLNNLEEVQGISRENAAERLMDLQLADGGWAVIGEVCDPDCTAMTLQALATLRDSDQRIQEAVDRGVEALSACQLEDGGYMGMGLVNAESCTQVILALSSLGIDCQRDERFIKPGGNPLTALLRFRLEDGSFAHGKDTDKANSTATVQAFYSLTGYRRMLRGQGPYYIFDSGKVNTEDHPGTEDEAEVEPEHEAEPGTEAKDEAEHESEHEGEHGADYETDGAGTPEAESKPRDARFPVRAILLLAVILAAAAACVISWKRKKKNIRTYAFIAGVAAALIAGIMMIQIESPESYYAGNEVAAENAVSTWISINCDRVAGKNQYAPEDGVILRETEIKISEGQTAFDQLIMATKANRIQMEYDGTTAGAYVRGIGYLYEYDFGNLSGWMYRINGVMADIGASQYTLREGDRVEWVYSTNIGKDIE